MRMLAEAGAVFVGQNVVYGGVSMFDDLNGVPMEKRIELPVMEDMQMGICTGLAIQGFLPVSIYPRCDFLLLAMSQLVLHLDKMETMSCGQYKPKVIIRTRVGKKTPLDAGPQHTGNYANAFRAMLRNVGISEVMREDMVLSAYEVALKSKRSTLVIEDF